MTDACNIPEGFEYGAAVRLPLDKESMSLSIQSFLSAKDDYRVSIGRLGKELVTHKFTWNHISNSMREVYEWMLKEGKPPATIFFN